MGSASTSRRKIDDGAACPVYGRLPADAPDRPLRQQKTGMKYALERLMGELERLEEEASRAHRR